MLAQIRKQQGKIAAVLLFAAATLMTSCATHKEAALVKDPDAKPEGEMPWNKQEKWETSSTQFANMTDHR